jgi:V/A-type H+-transporting ATPase subunit D
MAVLQYNKIALHQLEKALKMRVAALPVISSKESALRYQVKLEQQQLQELQVSYAAALEAAAAMGPLWRAWPQEFLQLKEVKMKQMNFAGVKYRELEEVLFGGAGLHPRVHGPWLFEARLRMQQLVEQAMRIQLKQEAVQLLENERKKTTQKMNLFEKVQIPAYESDIRKIKRFLEDEETLVKATQKLVKKKKEAAA